MSGVVMEWRLREGKTRTRCQVIRTGRFAITALVCSEVGVQLSRAPKHYLAFALPLPTSTMALNLPPHKVYDFPELAIDDINEFAKGQGYAVMKF